MAFIISSDIPLPDFLVGFIILIGDMMVFFGGEGGPGLCGDEGEGIGEGGNGGSRVA